MGLFDYFKDTLNKEKAKKAAKEEEHRKQIDFYMNGDISTLAAKSSDVLLKKNEYVYYIINKNCNWYEDRQQTKRINYRGIGTSVRIAKGIYYRAGSFKPSSQRITVSQLIHNGAIILSNKRIFVVNNSETAVIQLSSIAAINSLADGIVLSRNSGKVIKLQGFNPEVLSILISRLANDDTNDHYAEKKHKLDSLSKEAKQYYIRYANMVSNNLTEFDVEFNEDERAIKILISNNDLEQRIFNAIIDKSLWADMIKKFTVVSREMNNNKYNCPIILMVVDSIQNITLLNIDGQANVAYDISKDSKYKFSSHS